MKGGEVGCEVKNECNVYASIWCLCYVSVSLLNLNGHKDENDPGRFTYRYVHSSSLCHCSLHRERGSSASPPKQPVFHKHLSHIWWHWRRGVRPCLKEVQRVYAKWPLQWTCEFPYYNLSPCPHHLSLLLFELKSYFRVISFWATVVDRSNKGNEKSHFETC